MFGKSGTCPGCKKSDKILFDELCMLCSANVKPRNCIKSKFVLAKPETYPCSECKGLRTTLFDGLCLSCSDHKEFVKSIGFKPALDKNEPCSECGDLRMVLFDGLCLSCSDKKDIKPRIQCKSYKEQLSSILEFESSLERHKTICTGCGIKDFYGSLSMCEECRRKCKCGKRKKSSYDTECQECLYITKKVTYIGCSSCHFEENSNSCRTLRHLPPEKWEICWECKERPSKESKFMHELCPTCGSVRDCISKENFLMKIG